MYGVNLPSAPRMAILLVPSSEKTYLRKGVAYSHRFDSSKRERVTLYKEYEGRFFIHSSTTLRSVGWSHISTSCDFERENYTWIHKVNNSLFSQGEASGLRRWKEKDGVRGLRLVSSSTRIQPFICHVTAEPVQSQALVRKSPTY